MKKYIIGSFAALAIIFAGCSNGPEFKDAVFVTGTLSSKNVRFPVDGVSEKVFTVTSSAKATTDIKVKMQPAPELLEDYNKQTGRNFVLPPADSYTLEGGELVIKSGSSQSTQMKLVADGDKLQEGVSYCLPLTITDVEGDLNILETSRTAYVLFSKVISIKAANLAGRGGFDIPMFWLCNNPESPVQALEQMTLEMKVLPMSFGHGQRPNSGGAISSLCGCEENFLFRFGDGAGNPVNKLQFVKGSIGQAYHPDKKDHYESWVEKTFDTGHWLHFAAVYDGKYLRLYLDGEQIHFVETKNGGTVNLAIAYDGHNWESDGFSIGRSAGMARFFDGYISECRVWNVARTLDQINNGLCYVDPTSEGLIGYWRFNGEVQDDGSVRDETGHGYDAVPFGTVTYVDNQKCPY